MSKEEIGLTVKQAEELRINAETEVVRILSALETRTNMRVQIIGAGLGGPRDGDKQLRVILQTYHY